MQIKSIPLEKIITNKKIFHEKFVEYFNDELKRLEGEASGQPIQIVGHAKTVITITQWSDLIGQPIAILLPGLGPAISISAKIIETVIEIEYEKSEKAKAEEITACVLEASKIQIKAIIEEVSNELQRIFEYQIGAIADKKMVVQLATIAVSKILNHVKHSKEKSFDRNSLLEGVIKGKSSIKSSTVSTIWMETSVEKTPSNPKKRPRETKVKWELDKVFSHPGVCIYDGKSYNYYETTLEGISCDYQTYGFRGPLLQVVKDNYFIAHPWDDPFIIPHVLNHLEKKDITENYLPNLFIVKKNDLRHYANHLKNTLNKNKIKEFNQFVAELHFKDKTPTLIAVYRDDGRDHGELDLENGKFINTDFSRANFDSSELENSHKLNNTNFQNSNLISANLKGTEAKKIRLKNAKCMLCDFSNADLDEANLTQADMRYAVANSKTQMADVINIGTKVKNSTIYLAQTESKLKQEVKKLKDEVAELRKEQTSIAKNFQFWQKNPLEIKFEIALTQEMAEAILEAQSTTTSEPDSKAARLAT